MEPVTIAAIASGLASAAVSAISHFANRQDTKRINKQSQSNFENSYQITANDMVKAGYNPSALFQGGQLSQVPTLQQQQPFDASGVASLISALTNAKLAEHQADNIDADTKNKKGQFQHELDLQSNEFQHNLEVLGKTQEFNNAMEALKHSYKVDEMTLQNSFNTAIENLSAENKAKLIKIQAIFDDALQENQYQNTKDLDRRRYLANQELENLRHTHDYQRLMYSVEKQCATQLEAAGINASVQRDNAYINALSNLVDGLLMYQSNSYSAETNYRGRIDSASIYSGLE